MAKRRLLPSQEYLQECFDYNPKTGILHWKERPLHHFKTKSGCLQANARFAGKEAGTLASNGNGYTFKSICINYTRYVVARIVYKLVHNEEPVEIDHIDINPENLKLLNLRPCTSSQNKMNRNVRSNSRTGLKGVGWYSPSKKYRARIKIDGKEITLGYFDDPKKAYEAYCKAAPILHGKFHRT